MRQRLLPREEWHRLPEQALRDVAQDLPQGTNIIVIEVDGEIIANWMLMPTWRLEGMYCAPEYRRHAGVARRMLVSMRQLMNVLGVRTVFTTTIEPVMDQYVRRYFRNRFTEMPGITYVLRVGD